MNYFNYFTEIETRFLQRRGSILMLSTLDWALVDTWREAGVPLEAVLRGIDAAFDKHVAQRARLGNRRQRQVNGLAWCAQAVLEAVEQAKEAAAGAASGPARHDIDSGFEPTRIARYLTRNAAALDSAAPSLAPPASTAAVEIASRLRSLGREIGRPTAGVSDAGSQPPGPPLNLEPRTSNLAPGAFNLEDLDRTLTVLEEKLFAALLTAAPEDELIQLRAQADRELAPYRGRMGAVQIKQVQRQFMQKRLLEAHTLPRLSLFYMPHADEA